MAYQRPYSHYELTAYDSFSSSRHRFSLGTAEIRVPTHANVIVYHQSAHRGTNRYRDLSPRRDHSVRGRHSTHRDHSNRDPSSHHDSHHRRVRNHPPPSRDHHQPKHASTYGEMQFILKAKPPRFGSSRISLTFAYKREENFMQRAADFQMQCLHKRMNLITDEGGSRWGKIHVQKFTASEDAITVSGFSSFVTVGYDAQGERYIIKGPENELKWIQKVLLTPNCGFKGKDLVAPGYCGAACWPEDTPDTRNSVKLR